MSERQPISLYELSGKTFWNLQHTDRLIVRVGKMEDIDDTQGVIYEYLNVIIKNLGHSEFAKLIKSKYSITDLQNGTYEIRYLYADEQRNPQ